MQTVEELKARIAELDAEYEGRQFPDSVRQEWNELNEQLEEQQARRDRVAELAKSPGARVPGYTQARRRIRDRGPAAADRDKALRTIEEHADVSSAEAQDRLDRHVREHDPAGIDARWIAAVGQPAYMSAFGKLLQDPQQGHLRFEPDEVEAMQRVTAVQEEQRTLQESVTTAGGFAVPYQLDPTLLFSSNGRTNPIRELARTETISVKEWRGVSTGGTVASFVPELQEATDDSPVLAQPTVFAHRWQAFVPISIELLADWDGATREISRVFSDARDELEASKFLDGTAVNEPSGVLNRLTTTQRVQATAVSWNAGTTGVTNAVYAVAQALPERFRPGATWTANPTTFDKVYRSVGGNSGEPAVLPNREGPMLARPIAEWSTMNAGTAVGQKLAIYGDYQSYLIAERLGMTVEVVPHVLGSNRRPIGARGLYAYGRTGGSAIVPNAFRYLELS